MTNIDKCTIAPLAGRGSHQETGLRRLSNLRKSRGPLAAGRERESVAHLRARQHRADGWEIPAERPQAPTPLGGPKLFPHPLGKEVGRGGRAGRSQTFPSSGAGCADHYFYRQRKASSAAGTLTGLARSTWPPALSDSALLRRLFWRRGYLESGELP